MRGPGTWVLGLRLESTPPQWAAGWAGPQTPPPGLRALRNSLPRVSAETVDIVAHHSHDEVMSRLTLRWSKMKLSRWGWPNQISLQRPSALPDRGFEAGECEGLPWPQGKGRRASNNLEWLLARNQQENGRLVQELPGAEQPECIRKRAPGIRQDPRTSWGPSFNLVRPT